MFSVHTLDFETNMFDELHTSSYFEPITLGRVGAILVDDRDGHIPIVRTTTKYEYPAQRFKPLHYDIMGKISEINPELKFNNAMIEIYTNSYRSMKYHSGQATDLAPGSFICIYTCYDDPTTKNLRKLYVTDKLTSEISVYTLKHNSVVFFSLETNSKHLHKIVLENPTSSPTNWLGITFRLSKTFSDISPLHLANETETKEFYKLRGEENKAIDFSYPEIDYTISPSDLMPVV